MKYLRKITVWVLVLYFIGHIVHIVTVGPLSNYLRQGMNESLSFNRFDGGLPGGGPGGSIDARGRFFGAWLLCIARGTIFFGTRN